MTDDAGSNGRVYSVKDILTEFVLPRLATIDAKLDSKADAVEVRAMEVKLDALERSRNRLAGALAVLMFVFPLASITLSGLIHHHIH